MLFHQMPKFKRLLKRINLSDDQVQESSNDQLNIEEGDLEPLPDESVENVEESEEDPLDLLEEEIIESPGQPENLIIDSELEQTAEIPEVPKSNELDLGLPDPETIRKVDALLSGKPTEEIKENPAKDKSTSSGMTSIVANVMIGIGNKPCSGRGPGLS